MKSGIVVLAGKPNTGKSTLLNYILKEKIAPVSSKPQTTRKRLKGIYTEERGQIVFIDSPGLHKPTHILGKYMVEEAIKNLYDGDILLWIVDSSKKLTEEDYTIYERIKNIKKPKILAINKIDIVNPKRKEFINELNNFDSIDKMIPISSTTGENVDTLLDEIFNILPEGEYLYDPDILTDSTEREIVSEIIREKILIHTEEEIPHSVAVLIDDFKERENGKLYIKGIIYVEKESQRKILIGHQGNLIKKIGIESRIEIERFLGKPVFLELWVKVYKNWRKKKEAIRYLGYK